MNLLIVCGPTATGKSKVALALAKRFNGELISADSRQVYTGMDIITGKEKQMFPSHLYDVVCPDQEFSVAQYQKLADDVIKDIHKKKKLPIIVGGTGLYIDALVKGIDTVNVPKNDLLRKELEMCSISDLQEKLQALSTDTFSEMNYSDQNNPRRLIRKIEILSDMSSSQERGFSYSILSFNSLWIGLTSDRETLKQNIVKRVDHRLEQGAIQEVKRLLSQGYTWDLPSFQAIGYQEWREYMSNPTEELFHAARNAWILHEQQYVKRQLTWFKRNKAIHWYNIQDSLTEEKITQKVKEFLTQSSSQEL